METTDTKKIKLRTEGLRTFSSYLQTVLQHEFEVDPVVLGFIQYHYEQITHKIIKKTAALLCNKRTEVQMSLTYAEVKTLSILFKLIPCTGYMLTIEFAILDGLTLE